MTDLEARLASALADRYRLERELGEGGMAIVYLAEDLRHHRKVAVKVLRPELAPAAGGERFLREIEIAAGLRHPHIIPLYDSGEADGLLYYVMPLVEGESLRARLERERQLPIDDALRYAREVADALSYAHAHGVVHRDIKPENILIESGHAVVADFGIAKAVAAAGATTLTGVGMAIGTPAYMSPEQAAGGGDVDGRSDLYSLACVVYESLAGQPPFTGATTESLVRQHIMASPPPVTQFRPAVPAAVSDALMRAMAKAPADRFNPVGQFSSALDHSSVTTAPVLPMARRRALWPIAAAAVFVLALGGGAWSLLGRRATSVPVGASPRTIAVLPFDNITGDSSIAPLILGMHAEMITQLTKLGGLTVTSRSSALQYSGSHKSEREIASELGVATVLTGSAQRSGDQVRFAVSLADASQGKELWAESYDRPYTAATVFAVQGDIARQVANALRVKLSDQQKRQIAPVATSNLKALDLYYRALAQWETRGATATDTLVAEQLERAIALDSGFVAAWCLLAQDRSWLVRLGIAKDTVPAWAAMHRTQVLAPGSLEAALAAGYYRYYALGDYAGALRQLSAADSIVPNSSDVLDAMALLQRRLGHWDEAIALLRRASDVDPRNPKLLADLGETYANVDRPQEALAAFDRSLAMAPTSPKTLSTKFDALASIGDTAGARALLQSSSSLLAADIRAQLETDVAFFARDFEGATAAARGMDERFYSNFEQRSLALALASALRGDSASARLNAASVVRSGRAELERRGGQASSDAFGRRSAIESQMGVALALRGEHEPAVRLAEKGAAGYGLAQDAMEGCYTQRWLALTYTIVGRRSDAIAVLRRVHGVPGCPTSAVLRLDPMFDGLRADPEFQRLVAAGQ